MKTYKKVIESPRLVIEYDDAESPRAFDNLGYFYTIGNNNYISPDGNTGDIYQIMLETGEVAKDTDDHIKLMTEAINSQTDERVIAIFPVYRYDHSGVVYRRGTASGFDYSNCGFYIVTDKTQKLVGTPKNRFEKVIDAELGEYTSWANGEVYRFTLYDEDGFEEDSCGGFYDINDMKDHLPEEWKDEDLSEYVKN